MTKFRGLDINNIWVYGFLFQDINVHTGEKLSYIIKSSFVPAISMPAERFIEVRNDSVGQYIGLKDKHGKEIKVTEQERKNEAIKLKKTISQKCN